MYGLISELYPICRSITGDGVHETLRIISRYIPLEIRQVPTGTKVFDWSIPKEWNINDAYVRNSRGEKVIDFSKSNLHVVGYSAPVHKTMTLNELREHLITLPEKPDWIPYRTSYFNGGWGFCVSHNQLLRLEAGLYEVVIDSSLSDGCLSYGELLIEGGTGEEILLSSHVCHPSLCNDNLSGISLATALAKDLGRCSLRYSYRFLFIPATIGSIAWLALNQERISRIKHGLVLACVGDSGKVTYKKSRQGNAEIDVAMRCTLRDSGQDYEIIDFFPYGYDERQYCSPGFNLPVGSLMRTPHGRFPEYHTSADNLDFVKSVYLADSYSKCVSSFRILENNRRYLNLNPRCEPQLGRRGIYRAMADQKDGGVSEMAMLWVLNMSDGNHNVLDISERSGLSFETINKAVDVLVHHNLLEEIGSHR